MRGAGIRVGALVALLVFGGCSDPADGEGEADGGIADSGVPVDTRDSDGDTISDSAEGRDTGTDTDGDGTPDYLDEDSDGDGIADAEEAGDEVLATPPRDSDRDGAPDFQDADSDDNGIVDAAEATGDTDGDGLPDYADTDDDDDGAIDRHELMAVDGDPEADTDGDGTPNFKDPDSDDDTISDGHEAHLDTDGDGIDDWSDTDSDGDGIPDAVEAGDADPSTPPVDSDGDGTPDFRDADSDDDGLSDRSEVAAGTSPTNGDSDEDGVSDLIEDWADTDPLDASDNPREHGDFVFVVPFEEPPTPDRDTLEFRTDIQFADVYFLFDQTTSMEGEIDAMKDAAETVIDDLTCRDFGTSCTEDEDCGPGQACSFEGSCIADPSTTTCVPNIWTGTGAYWHGWTYRNNVSLQPDPATTVAGFPDTEFGGGEALVESVSCIADPSVCPDDAGCTGPIGCPSFREDAVRILVTITDERDECQLPTTGTWPPEACSLTDPMAAASRLVSAGITFVGVYTRTPPDDEIDGVTEIARESSSLDLDGDPLVFVGEDSGVVPALTAGINEVVEGLPLRVTIEATDEPGDAGDALQFIDRLEVDTSGGACTMVSPTEDSDGDGFDDTFPALPPGTPVCWNVIPRMNAEVRPTEGPQVFRAKLTVLGRGSPLDSRIVFFLVPPEVQMPPGLI